MLRRLLPALILALCLPLTSAPAGAQTVAEHEWDLVARLNRLRYEAGLDALIVRDDLRRMARTWSERMTAENRLRHNPELFTLARTLIPTTQVAGENVARASTVPRMHDAWAASPGHRANMLGDYRYVGVGVAGQYWGTQVFVRAPAGLIGVTRVPVRRLSGPNAVETALAVSRATVADASADALVVARLDVFADALVGAPLAGAGGGPVLLTDPADVPDSVVREARRVLRPSGAVYLMGGPAALAPGVEARFLAAGMRVHRVAGRDRFETAAHAATVLNPAPSQVLLASGEHFADALSAGVPAAVHRLPIVLTMRDALPPATGVYLASRPTARRTVIGGEAAISHAVAAQAGAADRVAGSNRYATSVRIAERWFPQPAALWVATGDRHQDPLVAVPGAARERRPLLLVPAGGERTLYDYSRVHVGALREATAVGGLTGVREPVLSLLFN